METNLIMEAAKFMVLGMGVVFSFLIILIFVLKAQGALFSKYFPAQDNTKKTSNPQTSSAKSNTAKVAAITAAVQHHRNLKG